MVTEDPMTSCEDLPNSPYSVTRNTYYQGGVLYTGNPTATLAQCKAACEGKQGLPACVGFDYS